MSEMSPFAPQDRRSEVELAPEYRSARAE